MVNKRKIMIGNCHLGQECILCWPLHFEQCIVKFRHALDILLGDIGSTMPSSADILMHRTVPNGRFGGDEGDEERERKSGGAMAPGGGGGTASGTGTGAFLTVRG